MERREFLKSIGIGLGGLSLFGLPEKRDLPYLYNHDKMDFVSSVPLNAEKINRIVMTGDHPMCSCSIDIGYYRAGGEGVGRKAWLSWKKRRTSR